jgi:trehalose 6-phosphate phosphatase
MTELFPFGPAARRATMMFDALAGSAASTGILLDVDGTLSPIVARPELAELAARARPVLSSLVGRYRVVAAISGRTVDQLERLVDVRGVKLVGSYGLATVPVPDDVISAVFGLSDEIEGAWVETKGSTIAVHYRASPDGDAAGGVLEERLGALADAAGMALVPGKRVVELVPAGMPLKEAVVDRIIEEEGLRAALYAGDDVADLRAFEALDRAREEGRLEHTVKVAVRGVETPDDLVPAADVVVEGPAAMVELLAWLSSLRPGEA